MRYGMPFQPTGGGRVRTSRPPQDGYVTTAPKIRCDWPYYFVCLYRVRPCKASNSDVYDRHACEATMESHFSLSYPPPLLTDAPDAARWSPDTAPVCSLGAPTCHASNRQSAGRRKSCKSSSNVFALRNSWQRMHLRSNVAAFQPSLCVRRLRRAPKRMRCARASRMRSSAAPASTMVRWCVRRPTASPFPAPAP